MNQNKLSSMIKEIRALGWSQKQIADATGIPQGTISRIENCKHNDPRYSTATKLIHLFERLSAA